MRRHAAIFLIICMAGFWNAGAAYAAGETASPAAASEGEDTMKVVTFTDTQQALSDPDMGFMIYYYDNSTTYYDCMGSDSDLFEDIPGANTVYLRFPWCHVEPVEGRFNWSYIDTQIQKFAQVGKSVMLAITCAETGVQFATPKWVYDAGADGNFWYYGQGQAPEGQGLWMPDNTDPIFMAKLENLLAEMARKYDGNPNISCVEVRSLGIWGEGHADTSGIPIEKETIKDHADLHMKYFHETPVLIQEELVRDAGVSDYILNLGMGFREDSVVGDYVNNQWWNPGYAQNAADYWPVQPVALETLHIRESGNEWTQGNTLLQSIEDYHATYVSIHHYARSFALNNQAFMEAANSRIGYRLMPVQASWKQTAKAGEQFPVSLTWQNSGVAPFYKDGWPRITIKDQDGNTVAEWEDQGFHLDRLEVGAAGEAPTRINTMEHTLPYYLADGQYTIYVSAVRSDGSGLVDMPMNTEEQDGLYLLGDFWVSGQVDMSENPVVSGRGNRVSIVQEDFEIADTAYPASGREFTPVRLNGGTADDCKFDIVTEGDNKYIALRNTNVSSGAHPNLVSAESFSGEFGATFDFRFPSATEQIQHVYISPMYSQWGESKDTMIRLEKNKITLLSGQVERMSAVRDFNDGAWYSMRIAVTDAAVYAKVWERGTAEPADWTVKYEQYSGLASRTPMQFRIGYLGRSNDGSEQSFYLDNLNVYRAYYMQIEPDAMSGQVGTSQQAEAVFAPALQQQAEAVLTDGIRININDIYNKTEKKYRIAEIEVYDKYGENIAAKMSVNTEAPAVGKLGVMTTNIPVEPPAANRDFGVAHLIDGDIELSKSWFITSTPPLSENAWQDHYIQFDFTEPMEIEKVILYCDENLALQLGVKNIDIQTKQNGSWTDQRAGVELTWPDVDAEQANVNAQTIMLTEAEAQGYCTRGVRFKINEIYKKYDLRYRVSEIELFGAFASAPDQRINLAPYAQSISANVGSTAPDNNRNYHIANVTHVTDATEALDKSWFVFLTEFMDAEAYTGPAYDETYIQFDFAEDILLSDVAVSIDNGLGPVQGIKNMDIQILNGNGNWVTVKPNVELAWQNAGSNPSPYETIAIPVGFSGAAVTWTSDDPSIADVSPNGLVSFLSTGRTVIRANYGLYNEAVLPVEVYDPSTTPVSVKIATDPAESSYLANGTEGSVSIRLQKYEAGQTIEPVDVYMAVYDSENTVIYCDILEHVSVSDEPQVHTFQNVATATPGQQIKAFIWYGEQTMQPAAFYDIASVMPVAASLQIADVAPQEPAQTAEAVAPSAQSAASEAALKLSAVSCPEEAEVRGTVNVSLTWQNYGGALTEDLYPAVTLRDKNDAIAGVFVADTYSLKTLPAGTAEQPSTAQQNFTFTLPDVFAGGTYDAYISVGNIDGTPVAVLQDRQTADDLRYPVGTLSVEGDYDVEVTSLTESGGIITAVMDFVGYNPIPSTNSPILEAYRADARWLSDVQNWRTDACDIRAYSNTWSSSVRNQLNSNGRVTVTMKLAIDEYHYGKSYALKINMDGTDEDIIQSADGRFLQIAIADIAADGTVSFREIRQ